LATPPCTDPEGSSAAKLSEPIVGVTSPPPPSKTDPDVGEALPLTPDPVTPDGIASLPVVGLPDGGVSPEPVPDPGMTTGGTGAEDPLPPEPEEPPLGGLVLPPLLGGELGGELGGRLGGGLEDGLDGEVVFAGGGVFAGLVVPGLVFLLLPPTRGAMIGARMGIEGTGMGSLMSCGSRA
jgi:hypothetical protein